MGISTRPQATLLHTVPPPALPQPFPGEFRWAIRTLDGVTLACELRDRGQLGVEVQLSGPDQCPFVCRWPDRSSAVLKADDLKVRYIRDGGILLPDHSRTLR